MVEARLRLLQWSGVVLGLAVGPAGCSEPTLGPAKSFQWIAVGDTITGNLGGSGTQLFAFHAHQDSLYAVFLQSGYLTKQVTVTDTGNGLVLTDGQATAGLTLLERATEPFYFDNAPVSVAISGDPGAFRFLVYPVRPGPEGRSARFALGDTVQESLQTLADIDTFTFAGQAGQEVIGYLQALNDSPLGTLSLQIDRVVGVGSLPGANDLEQNATGRFLLPATRDYGVTLRGAPDFYSGYRTYRGPYRFQVRSVQRAPEHVPGVITPGDSITSEALDYVGDVDAFAVSGSPGELVNVFLQVRTGSPDTKFFLRGTLGDSVVAAASTTADTSLFSQSSGRLALGGVGRDSVLVEGELDHALADRGPYGLFVYHVNPAPETAAPALVAGDSVVNEAIDLPGDLDTFQVAVPESGLVNVAMQPAVDANGAGVALALESPGGVPLASLLAGAPGVAVGVGAVAVPAGNYRLRVNSDSHSGFRGHYRIWTYAGFTSRPENAPDTIVVGDTISAESISAPGDVDLFYIHGERGDHLNLALQGQGAVASTQGGFEAAFSGPPYVTVGSPTIADSLGTYQSNRMDLPVTGWYQVAIYGYTDTPPVPAGHYRFAVTNFGTSPEQVSASLVPGDSVVAESIDYPGDWDQFTLTGTPGQTIAVMTRLPQEPTTYSLVTVFDSIMWDTLASVVPQGFDKATSRFALPPSGKVQIAVYQPPFYYSFTGSYYLRVIPVNRAPENLPAAFAIGDTIRGEAIVPAMDLDEFTGSGTPGQQLAPHYRLTADPSPAGLITLEVVDPTTGAILAGSGAAVSSASTDFFSPGSFIVPASGQFTIRVRSAANDDTTAPYEFYVQ